jgi:hypothetical protein
MFVQWILSKPNLLWRTNFCVRNRQVFCLYSLNHQRFPTLVRFKKDSSLIRVRFHCTTIRAFSLLCKYVHTHLFTIHLLDVVVRQLNGSLLYTECFNKHSLLESFLNRTNVGNRWWFKLYKQNTCLFRTQKLVLQRRFGLESIHCIHYCI